MPPKLVDQTLTAKHARLIRIASIANALVWIVVGVHVLIVIARAYSLQSSLGLAGGWDVMRAQPAFLLGQTIEILSTLLRGAAFALGLKGIALGLNMIVETDLNYRGKTVGGDQ